MSQRVDSQILICAAISAEKIGLNEAIVLQQIFYMQKKFGDNKWINNSYKVWKEEFRYLSRNTIRRTFASLVKKKLLERKQGQRCNLYRLVQNVENEILLLPTGSYTSAFPNALEQHAGRILKASETEGMPQQMLNIWEGKIPTAGQSLSLTVVRQTKLQELFITTFDSKLERWESFVNQIARSDFLMGKVPNTKFKVFLDWAIVPENCINILEGAYTNKGTDNKIMSSNKTQESISSHLDSIDNKDWLDTAKLLIQSLGMQEYQSWFYGVRFKKYENNCVYLETETKFFSDWIDGHYSHKIRRAWIKATGKQANSVVIKPIS